MAGNLSFSKARLNKIEYINQVCFQIIALLFLFIATQANAQDNVDSLKNEYREMKIHKNSLLGIWYLNDSIKIEFTQHPGFVSLEPRTLANNYTFNLINDSVSTKGIAINWPPYDCILNLIDPNTLEIKYFRIYYKFTTNQIYRREN
jgi:hypothetical protein